MKSEISIHCDVVVRLRRTEGGGEQIAINNGEQIGKMASAFFNFLKDIFNSSEKSKSTKSETKTNHKKSSSKSYPYWKYGNRK